MLKAIFFFFCSFIFCGCFEIGSSERGNRIAFKEINVGNNAKLISVYVFNESALESSDSWNNYTLELLSAKTGSLEFVSKYTNEAHGDDSKVLTICNKFTLIKAKELVMISNQTPGLILSYDSIYKRIETANTKLKNNIGVLNTEFVNFLKVISKQGDAFIISCNTFKAYPSKTTNTFIEDSLAFEPQTKLPLTNVFGPNYTQRVIFNDSLLLSLEVESMNNTNKQYLYTFNYKKIKYTSADNKSDGFVSFTVDTTGYNFKADPNTRTKIYNDCFLTSRLIGLANNSAYIKHNSMMGDSAKELTTKFNLQNNKIDWTIDLNQLGFKSNFVYYETVWSNDLKNIYLVNYRSSQSKLLKIDALTGKLIYAAN